MVFYDLFLLVEFTEKVLTKEWPSYLPFTLLTVHQKPTHIIHTKLTLS